jgi:hypothetical protein
VTRGKLMTFAIGSLAVSSLALTVAVLIAPSTAAAKTSAASRYGVINATVSAATVHEIAGSTAFPNFTTGAVDNYYSLAHSEMDNSPSAEGTASPGDTGPIGQTAAASHFQQPQYADARWPGKSSGQATVGKKGGGPYAVAGATSYKATAESWEASGSNGSSTPGLPVPKADSKKLQAALAAWKAKWLVPLGLKLPSVGSKPKVPVPVPTVPKIPTTPVPTPTVPTIPGIPKAAKTAYHPTAKSSSGNGGGLLESATLATVDPKSGDVVTKGESDLGRVSIAGGQIVIRGIDVYVTVTNNGKAKSKVSVDIGAASIGGVPVTIDQDGVHVQKQHANLPYAKADDALNAALKNAGIKLHTVTPEIKKKQNEQTITATGVHVGFVQPAGAPGVPSQFVDHIVGEVFVDSLATPAGPIPKLGLAGGLGSALGGTPSGGGYGSAGLVGGSDGGGVPSSGYSSQPASSGTTPPQAAPASSALGSLARKPMWLLAFYLVWQTLVIGTGVSLKYWWAAGAS